MDYRNYAARETSALVERLAAGAACKVAGELQELRQAFDMVKSAIESALTSQVIPDPSADVAALADRLGAEAAKQVTTATDQVRKEAQAVIDQLKAAAEAQANEKTSLVAALKEASAQVEKLRAALDTQKDLTETAHKEYARVLDRQKQAETGRAELEKSLEKARRDHAAANEQLQALRKQLAAARDDAASAAKQRDAEAAEREKTAASLNAASAKAQAAEAQNKELLAKVKAGAADIEALKRAAAEQQQAAQVLRTKLDDSTSAAGALEQRMQAAERESGEARVKAAKAAQTAAAATRAREEAEARAGRLLTEQADTLRQHAGAFLSLSLDRLLALDECAPGGAPDDVLAAVVDALALQFARVALFRVQSNHLEGVRQLGFDLQADISQVLIPRTLDSLVNQAVASAQLETRSGGELKNSGMPFGGNPEFGLALPIIVDGQALAVVYADDSGGPHSEFGKPELRSKFAELVRRRATPVLTRVVAQAKALAELDEYAALLLTEIEHTYAADLEASKDTPDAERQQQLMDNLDYARRLYGQRATSEGPWAAGLFEQRLFTAVEARSATRFGRDLAAVLGRRAATSRASSAG